MEPIRLGHRGPRVADVQARLQSLGTRIEAREADAAWFDASTEAAVRAFQQQRGLIVDGVVGPSTWRELVEAGYALGDRVLYLRAPPFRGDDVRGLQEGLDVLGFDPGRADGIFGDRTSTAVQDFQRNVGLQPDGIVGATTLDALGRLRPPLPGPGRVTVREEESLRSSAPLAGRTVTVDAGHDPSDPGGVGAGGLTEEAATILLAEALAEELTARGAEPVLLRFPGETPDADHRVRRAREVDADVVVSIHLNSHDDPAAEGSSSYYFGQLGTVSVPGRALAELIQEELTGRLGLRDGRTHQKAFPLLRETPMPAVHVEPCFITNPKEEQLLGEEAFRRDVARAVADAVERFFAGPPQGRSP
jgi:N-acetylmuramoyl-L-alanine amidase